MVARKDAYSLPRLPRTPSKVQVEGHQRLSNFCSSPLCYVPESTALTCFTSSLLLLPAHHCTYLGSFCIFVVPLINISVIFYSFGWSYATFSLFSQHHFLGELLFFTTQFRIIRKSLTVIGCLMYYLKKIGIWVALTMTVIKPQKTMPLESEKLPCHGSYVARS